MKTAKSGRKYKKVPENMDIETWDKMTVIERMKYLGVIEGKKCNSQNYTDMKLGY